MTRSSRLLAAGIVVLGLALVVLLLAQRDTDPIVVDEAAPAADVGAPPADAAPGGPVERLPDGLDAPDGHEVVAVTTGYDAAVAGLPVPGDRVNLYGVFDAVPPPLAATDDEAAAPAAGAARALAGVEVLGVTGVEPASGGGTVTLLLALTPDDALTAIHLAGNERLWFTLAGASLDAPVGAGVTHDTVLGR